MKKQLVSLHGRNIAILLVLFSVSCGISEYTILETPSLVSQEFGNVRTAGSIYYNKIGKENLEKGIRNLHILDSNNNMKFLYVNFNRPNIRILGSIEYEVNAPQIIANMYGNPQTLVYYDYMNLSTDRLYRGLRHFYITDSIGNIRHLFVDFRGFKDKVICDYILFPSNIQE